MQFFPVWCKIYCAARLEWVRPPTDWLAWVYAILARHACHAKQFLPSNSYLAIIESVNETKKYIITLSNAAPFGQRFQWRRTTKIFFFRSLEKSLFNSLVSQTHTHTHIITRTHTQRSSPNYRKVFFFVFRRRRCCCCSISFYSFFFFTSHVYFVFKFRVLEHKKKYERRRKEEKNAPCASTTKWS